MDIVAWRAKSMGLKSMGLHRVRHNRATNTFTLVIYLGYYDLRASLMAQW